MHLGDAGFIGNWPCSVTGCPPASLGCRISLNRYSLRKYWIEDIHGCVQVGVWDHCQDDEQFTKHSVLVHGKKQSIEKILLWHALKFKEVEIRSLCIIHWHHLVDMSNIKKKMKEWLTYAIISWQKYSFISCNQDVSFYILHGNLLHLPFLICKSSPTLSLFQSGHAFKHFNTLIFTCTRKI
jgi:hypothetical protein